MEIIGRVTRDAEIRTLKDGRQLVSFSIAMNDQYKTKDGKRKQATTFVNCAYWQSTKVASFIHKGTILSLYGHLSINSYKDIEGEMQASLAFHVNNIKFIAQIKQFAAEPTDEVVVNKDDLPF